MEVIRMQKFNQPKTKDDYVGAFREMWIWIHEQTLKRRRKITEQDYFDYVKRVTGTELELNNNSFLCECNKKTRSGECTDCPVQWVDSNYKNAEKCVGCSSLYQDWTNCKSDEYEKAALLAIQIAEVLEKQ